MSKSHLPNNPADHAEAGPPEHNNEPGDSGATRPPRFRRMLAGSGPLPHKWRVLLASVLLFQLIVLTFTGQVDQAVAYMGMERVAERNETYLEEAFEKAVAGFGVLSGIKGTLAVIEGSGIGVGFNLEIGDIVQPVYDYVDIAWKASLAGAIILLLTKLLLETLPHINAWLLSITLGSLLVVVILQQFFPRRKQVIRVVKELLLATGVLAVAFYFILPLSITGASLLSQHVTEPLVAKAQNGFERLRADLSMGAMQEQLRPRGQAYNDPNWMQALNLREHYEAAKESVRRFSIYVAHKSENLALHTVQLVAGYFFDCVIFPLVLFYIFFSTTKGLMSYTLGLRKEYTFTEDLELLFEKYFGGWQVLPVGSAARGPEPTEAGTARPGKSPSTAQSRSQADSTSKRETPDASRSSSYSSDTGNIKETPDSDSAKDNDDSGSGSKGPEKTNR